MPPAGSNVMTDNVAPTLIGNYIHDPTPLGAPPNDLPTGVTVFGDFNAAAPNFGATLRRNRIIGHNPAVRAGNTDGVVSLDSDLLVGAPDGLSAFSNTSGDDFGDVSATNVTVVGGSRAIVLQHTHLTLDSSLVDQSINDAGSGGADTATCTISFSRGLNGVSPPGAVSGCDDFATGIDPQFVNSPADPGLDDFHLQPTSPLIDAGNPAAPAPGAMDFDGDPRALASNCPPGPGRRDIGADEFAPDCPEPTPPPEESTPGDTSPPETTLTKVPKDKTKRKQATFEFIANEPSSTFQCAVDGQTLRVPCTSPYTVKVKKGKHTFRVRATDPAGTVDPTPATDNWKVKRKKK